MDASDATRIVDEIIADLRDRRGLKHEWAQIDHGTKAEIRSTWTDIVMGQNLDKSLHAEDRLAAALTQWKLSNAPVSERAQALARALADLLVHYMAS